MLGGVPSRPSRRARPDFMPVVGYLTLGVLLVGLACLPAIGSSITIHTPTSSSPVHVECCDCLAGNVTIQISWDVTDHPSYVAAHGVIAKMGIRHHDGTSYSTRTYSSGGGSCSDWTETKHADPEVCGSYYVEAEIYARTSSGRQGTLLASRREDDAVIVDCTEDPILDYGAGPSALDFGESEDSMEIIVRNAGGGTLNYSLSESCCWITGISPSSGSSTGEWNSHRVYVDRSCLPPGETDSYDIPISSNGGSGSVTAIIARREHLVSTPNTPSGHDNGTVGESLTFSAGGALCNQGHSVEYQFDWGDNSVYSSWSSSTSRSHSYGGSGEYDVRARARCAIDNSIISSWSSARRVAIGTHTVSTPDTPAGPNNGTAGESLPFSTGGASCSQGHPVEYQFDWGDGSDYSSWSSSTSRSHAYGSEETYDVRARARCAIDNSIVSEWSSTKQVTIGDVEKYDLSLNVILPRPAGDLPVFLGADYIGTCGESQTFKLEIRNLGGPIPTDEGELPLDVTVSLIDYRYRSSPLAWNGLDTMDAFRKDLAVVDSRWWTVALTVPQIESLNSGQEIVKEVSYVIPRRGIENELTPIATDAIYFEIYLHTQLGEDADYSDNERKVAFAVGVDYETSVNLLVFSLTSFLGYALPDDSLAKLADAGINIAWDMHGIATSFSDGDYVGGGIEVVDMFVEIAKYTTESALSLGAGAIMKLVKLPETAVDGAHVLLFNISVIRTLIDRGFEEAAELWVHIDIESIAYALTHGLFSSLSEARRYGAVTLQNVWDLVAEGAVDVADALGQGLITAANILAGIARGLVDVWWAIANGLLGIGEAIAQGLISGWEWATTGADSILLSAYHPTALSHVEILAVDSAGRRTGLLRGSTLEEIRGSQVFVDGESFSIWIPEDAGEFSVSISGDSQMELALEVTHSTAGGPVKLEYKFEVSLQTSVLATSAVLMQDNRLPVDTNGDGLVDDWLEPDAAFEIRKGDVNGDGRIDLADVRVVYQAALSLLDLTSQQLIAADINGDGVVGQDDACALAELISGRGDV